MSSKKKKKNTKRKQTKKQPVLSSKYSIGDVVLVQLPRNKKSKSKGKEHEYARIRWIGKTPLDRNRMYGIEYFKYKIGTHTLSTRKILDGKIGDMEPLFKTNKKGYGTFIAEHKLDKLGTLKWNKQKSDKAMKSTKFEISTFVDACTVIYLFI